MKGPFLSRKFLLIANREIIFNQAFYSKKSLTHSESGLSGMFPLAFGKNTQNNLGKPVAKSRHGFEGKGQG